MTAPRRPAQLFVRAEADLGEGPAWDSRTGEVLWVDIHGEAVHVATSAGDSLRTYAVGRHVGAVLPAEGRGYLLAVQEGWAFLEPEGAVTAICSVEARSGSVRMNDAKCDPRGRAFGGTMAYDLRPGAGRLFRLEPGPRCVPVLDGLTISNGLGWTADGDRMFFIDSGTQTLQLFEFDQRDGSISRPAVVATFDCDRDGMPDGLAVDRDGCVWVALWGGGEVRRYDPGGRLLEILDLPVSRPTSIAFVGPGLTTAVITTARHGLLPEQLEDEPLAGSLFTAEVSTPGVATTLWKDVR